MKRNQVKDLLQLKSVLTLFNESSLTLKIMLISKLHQQALPNFARIFEYHNLLLFLIAHPDNKHIQQLAEKELKRITRFLQQHKTKLQPLSNDSGLPYSHMITRFSHDLLLWMKQDSACSLTIDSYEENAIDLNTLLRFTLPSVEREETSAGLSDEHLLELLCLQKKQYLAFLLQQFSTLNHSPLLKDHLWESLKLFIDIDFKDRKYSISHNRLPVKSYYYHTEILKKFNHLDLIESALPSSKKLSRKEDAELVNVIRRSLVLTMRETDPSTYMEEKTLRLFELERGISIAIYGMIPERQLALQSYIGYTLFKNGLPAAYGGSWIFGSGAMFGLNIFELFRGGESGYMMCQLLRVYKQTFSLDYIEIESYQFGRDNPDGIKSGAFWFYYKYGFRSLDPALQRIAVREFQRLKKSTDYRTKESTLIKLAEANIALSFSQSIPIKVSEITQKITAMIAKEFKGNRTEAIENCKNMLIQQLKLSAKHTNKYKLALEEVALMAKACKLYKQGELTLLKKMIQSKAIDPYQYNLGLYKLFKK